MIHLTRRTTLALAATALGCLASLPVAAQAPAFPSKPITIVVPFAAAGPNDMLARALAERVSQALKQPVIVENRPGATGNIGAQAVARAPADGHTLLLTLDTSITANPELYGSRMGFDAERDLRPVASLARFSQMLVVNPATKIADFKQFVDAARKGHNYGSAGNASPGHLTMETLQTLTQSKLNHVPYRGAAPVVTDLIGGQIDAGFLVIPAVAQHVASGKLIALAVSGSKRSKLAPNVPTVSELGYPAATTEFSYVLLAPAATPEPIVKLLNAEFLKALAAESVSSKLLSLDIEPTGSTPQQAAAELKSGRERWSKIIKERGIQPE